MRWKNRPEGSNWGDFGADDQIGRLNWLGPEQVKKGIAEVQEGRTFCLSMPLDLPGGNILHPARFPPQRFATTSDGLDRFLLKLEDAVGPDFTDVVNDDRVMLTMQYSTQWDALAHVGGMFDADGDGEPEPVFYNGWRGGEDIQAEPCDECGGMTGTEAKKLGAENYGGPVVTAGGLLFLAATPDRRFRAFDSASGRVLWEHELPAAGFATPSTYLVDGRQYVVIAAGGGKLDQPSGGSYVAFALPAGAR